MEIVTNPGSNLLPEVVAHYGLHMAPQRIVAMGEEHDTRKDISYEEIDRWIKTSPEYPYVIGTTAQEFLTLFQSVARVSPEILVITTSRKIIQTHAAALAAARSLSSSSAYKHVRIEVVDTGMTDVGAGLITMLAGEANRAGLGIRETVTLLERAIASAKLFMIPESLEYLVKGGRASWVRSLLADVLRLRPIVSFVNGESKSIGTVGLKDDRVAALGRLIEQAFGKRKIWAAVAHTKGATFSGGALAGELRRRANVEYVYARSLHSSIYLHAGPGAVWIGGMPVDDLPWTPTVPPAF